MSDKTLTRTEISDAIADRAGVSRGRANDILETVLEEMVQGLIHDGSLKLSSFGSFTVRSKKNRVGRNPKTGEEVMIEPRKTISFHPSSFLKERVVGGKNSS